MTRFDAVGIGALNVDRLYKANRIAHEDEESFVTTHDDSCGGSAANAMVGLSRLGCKVGFIGKVGGDKEADLLIGDFAKEGVDTTGVVRAAYNESGVVMGFVDEQGQRALYIHSGANDSLALEEINREYVSQTRFLHLSSFVGEKSFQTQKDLLRILPENVKVSFDPGALYAKRGLEQLKPILEKSYVVMPNAIELSLITGEKNYQRGALALVSLGVHVVAVKLGANGCFVTDGQESLHIEAFKVPVVDTTGAGDAFCAGFLYGLLKNKGLLECGRLGNFVASRSVMKMGARTNLPYAKDLKDL